MEILFINENNPKIALLESETLLINTTDDAFDIMINCRYQDADAVILYAKNIHPLFFDLRTGMAGEILQKFTTYGVRLAIVGHFEQYESKSLTDFIYESNKRKFINFVSTTDEALKVLIQ